MARDPRKLRPVHEVEETRYPSYRDYRDQRRTVLRWLGAGGAAVAAGGLLGCDAVHDLLARPPIAPAGEPPIAHHPGGHPAGPGDDDDSAARPEIETTKGEIVAPEPPTPENLEGTGGVIEAHHNPDAQNRGGIRQARPEAQLKGDVAMPDPTPTPESVPVHPEGKLRGRMVMPENPDE